MCLLKHGVLALVEVGMRMRWYFLKQEFRRFTSLIIRAIKLACFSYSKSDDHRLSHSYIHLQQSINKFNRVGFRKLVNMVSK